MKLKYNDSENTIEIKDGLKNQYLILKILMILNLANALIRLIGRNKSENGLIEYFWIAIGTISIIALFFFLFKNSTAEKIKVGQIKRLNEKSVFGRKRFSLELKNGKKRILGNFKNEFELVKMRDILTKVGISN